MAGIVQMLHALYMPYDN